MEKKEIKRVLERIYRFLKDNKGRFYVDDCETVTLYEGMSEIIEQELDKAREEGKKELVKEIREAIKEDMEITDTEDRHYEIDKDIVTLLKDKEIWLMFNDGETTEEKCEWGGWGWYS